uniref:Cytochrome P450 dependent monooxygenase n=1 Tax=Stigmatella aurantiaca TaxID=41 RepID=Q8RJX6_STIAU|nr:cytochrome P450 dependent monooxygenase [Stigmatella aurantiaca Sg a15]
MDVAIVGGGPVGLMAANLLGSYGVGVLVLERESSPHTYPRAVALYDDALRTFQAVGLVEKQASEMMMDLEMQIVSGTGQLLIGVNPAVASMPFGHPSGGAMLQPLLEDNLRKGLGRFKDVELRLGHRVDGVVQDSEGVQLRVTSANGESYTVRARYALGCDGGKSSLREACGIELAGSTIDQPWLVIDTRKPTQSPPKARIVADAVRPMVYIPLPDRYERWETRLMRGETPEHFSTEQSVRDILAPWMKSEPYEIVRHRVYIHHYRLAERYRDRRIFLLGDAAHLVPPFGAQGLSSGIRDAVNLAWKVAMAVKGLVGSEVLNSYQAERRMQMRETMLGVRMMSMVVSPNKWTAPLRDGFFGLLAAIPPVRKALHEVDGRFPSRFRSGFFLRGGGAGDMIIQPRVRTQKGGNVLLDEVLGTGFAVVGMNREPAHVMSSASKRFWEGLGARFVRVVSGNTIVGEDSGVEGGSVVAADESGALTKWFTASGGDMAIVRPDRYVAALFQASRVDSVTSDLQRMLRAS